jgi:2-polyprenyl-3-methyl-5-hydroxy-6-metoxy-1,4-benzoquinol methylase
MLGFPPEIAPFPAPDSQADPPLRWEECDCLLCGSGRWQIILEAPAHPERADLRFAVTRCADCGLVFTNPRPTADSLGRFYPDNYAPHRPARAKAAGFWQRLARRLWPRRAPIPWHGEGRLLDFGCGGGSFLARMRDCGWRVTGVDASAAAVERVRARTGLRVLAGSLPHPGLAPGGFDVVTMWHALEHVPDPKAVLRAARRLLTATGRLYVAVPNIDSLAFRVFGPDWFALDLPRHLTHFTPRTLALMLEQTGFQVERIRMVRTSAWLRHSARLACRVPQPRRLHRWLRTKWLSRLTAAYSCLTGQSDCILATAVPHADR